MEAGTHRLLWTHHDRVPNESVFVLLHLVHLIRLVVGRAVVVDDANASVQLKYIWHKLRRTFRDVVIDWGWWCR